MCFVFWIFASVSFVFCLATASSNRHSVILPQTPKIPKERLKTTLPPHPNIARSKYQETIVSKPSSSNANFKEKSNHHHPSQTSYWRNSYDPWQDTHQQDEYWNYYPQHYPMMEYHKSSDYYYLIPLIIGGIVLALLPLATIFMTLMVNMNPNGNMPTATTIASGKQRNLPVPHEFLNDLWKTVGKVITNLDEKFSKENS